MHLIDLANADSMILPWLAGLLGGYLLGSVPFGLVLAKMAGYGDIRKIGSGNIGATNVLRTGNRFLALVVLICDSGKGAAAVLVAKLFGPDIAVLAALGAVSGHMFPVWLKFKGGKGVATTLGTLLAIAWPVGLATCATWLVAAVLFRISSLSALIAMAASPVYAYLWADAQRAELMILLAILVWVCHRENIARLLKGEEPKIGKKKKDAATQEEQEGEVNDNTTAA